MCKNSTYLCNRKRETGLSVPNRSSERLGINPTGFLERERKDKVKTENKKLKDMEKKMILTTGVNEKENIDFTELISKIGVWASEPVRLLGEYYSSVLERKLSIGQTWRLIEVQLAFFACIFPADLSVAVRLLAVAWLGSAVTRCRKAMKK